MKFVLSNLPVLLFSSLTISIFPLLSALMLMVRQQEGHLAWKKSCSNRVGTKKTFDQLNKIQSSSISTSSSNNPLPVLCKTGSSLSKCTVYLYQANLFVWSLAWLQTSPTHHFVVLISFSLTQTIITCRKAQNDEILTSSLRWTISRSASTRRCWRFLKSTSTNECFFSDLVSCIPQSHTQIINRINNC